MVEAVGLAIELPICGVADTHRGSVGMYALQLVHIAGYKVVTVASPKNHALCRSYGADFVFDVRRVSPIPCRLWTAHVFDIL